MSETIAQLLLPAIALLVGLFWLNLSIASPVLAIPIRWLRWILFALVAAAGANAAVRWMVEGSPYREGRWPLQPGRHRFRAVSSAGDSAEVTVRVE